MKQEDGKGFIKLILAVAILIVVVILIGYYYINSTKEVYYYVVMEFDDTEADQPNDVGASINGTIQITDA